MIILPGVRYGKISAQSVMSRFLCNLNVKRWCQQLLKSNKYYYLSHLYIIYNIIAQNYYKLETSTWWSEGAIQEGVCGGVVVYGLKSTWLWCIQNIEFFARNKTVHELILFLWFHIRTYCFWTRCRIYIISYTWLSRAFIKTWNSDVEIKIHYSCMYT